MYKLKTFYLKATPDHFITWIQDYWHRLRVIAVGGYAGFDDPILMCTTQAEPVTAIPGTIDWAWPQRFETWGRYVGPGHKLEVVRDLVSFTLWTLSNQRIKVECRWWEPENTERLPDGRRFDGVAIQVRKLLREIRQDMAVATKNLKDD